MCRKGSYSERGKVLARSYDYVIVRAGPAGCVVARRLVDGTDATVLLLEAGGPCEGVASLSNPPGRALTVATCGGLGSENRLSLPPDAKRLDARGQRRGLHAK